ncbi:MAG TPA: CYTH domain-containing protein [Cellvibrio sp.]|nr:CYTH domain-containing protein [Cellvibrio sp.]
MPKEIERKFLVDISVLALPDNGVIIQQGYIQTASRTAVRVRRYGEQAFLTIKGENLGAVRSEFEYEIPVADAEAMLNELCLKPFIAKTRYRVEHAAHIWEVDIFAGDNAGLHLAEIELQEEDEAFVLPAWAVSEVTQDSRYYNSNLVQHPFAHWGLDK